MNLVIISSAGVGAVISCLLACVPGLHVYNVVGVLLILADGVAFRCEVLVPLFVGLIVGYAVMGAVPSVFLAAPDESAFLVVLPGQKFMMCGLGCEAVAVTATGAMAGLFFLVFIVGPFGPGLLPLVRTVFQPHVHWILWCVICFMLMSEWPTGGTRGDGGVAKLIEGWRSTGVGLLTFALSGWLGFILFYRAPVSYTAAFQNLMPAFAGLFTIPWLILNVASGVAIPRQEVKCASNLKMLSILRGAFAGWLGGGFAAFFPVVSGGVGGFLAGHATALRDDRAFMISQGASRLVYYVGGFLLMFVPGLGIGRGGGAWLLRGLYVPGSWNDYYMVLGSVAISGAVSLLLVGTVTKLAIRIVERSSFRRMSVLALVLAITIVVSVTGLPGLAVMIVAGGIGMMPMLFGSRRMNCLGVILLPMACNMSGVGAKVAGWLGLL